MHLTINIMLQAVKKYIITQLHAKIMTFGTFSSPQKGKFIKHTQSYHIIETAYEDELSFHYTAPGYNTS